MASNDTLSFVLELKDKFSEQIRTASKDTEKLAEAINALNTDLKKLTAEDLKKNVEKNTNDAVKALYNLMDAKEKLDKAMSRNSSMRADGFLGMDESRLNDAAARIDNIIKAIMNIGAEANFSKNTVKDLLATMNSDIVLKDAKKATSETDKGLDRQLRERAKLTREVAKEQAHAEKEAEDAAKANVKNQELVKDALARIATARSRLSAAADGASQQDQMHAKLLMSLLDQLSHKLANLKGQFLGEKGILDGVLGSGYKGLMRNVDVAIRNTLNSGGISDEAWEALKREAEARSEASAAADRHKKKLAELNDAFDKQTRAEERAHAKQNAYFQSQQRASQATRQRAEELVRLRMEMLKTQAAELQSVLKNGKGVLSTQKYDEVRNALRAVREEMRQLDSAMQRLSSYSTRDLLNFGRGTTQDFSPLANYANDAIRASHAVNQLTDSERRFVEGISQATTALRLHGNVLADIQNMMQQYLSLVGARRILNNIIETGGLLEQQRLSIGAILGDMNKAEEIFSQIKDLALKSPFGVVELDKMSKQLTAYGFQYEELFDWTRRLADIGAATGTDVSRLALALGHVRNELALSGYTLRQFAMANVPMAGKLSEMKGVSVKEIREMVKKKQISDKDVEAVLKGLTDEGGMFYNAQEVMSGALNAKFKNLRDAFDIMYGEIAESGVGDTLKGIATTLTAAAKQWKRFGTDILAVASAFAVVKAAVYLYNMAIGQNTAATLKAAKASKERQAAELKMTKMYRHLTGEEQTLLLSKGKLTAADISLLLTEKKLTQADLERAVALGRVTKQDAMRAIALAQERDAQLQLNAAQMAGVRVLGFWGRAGVRFTAILNSMKVAAMSFVRSIGPLLAIGAVVDLFMRKSSQSDASTELADLQTKKLFDNLSQVNDLYAQLSEKSPKNMGEMADAIERITETLEENGLYSDELKTQVDEAEELGGKYRILYGELEKLSEKYLQAAASAQAYFEAANKVGGSFLTDDMKEDIGQLNEAQIEKRLAVRNANKYAGILKSELRKLIGDAWTEAYDSMDWKKIYDKVLTEEGRSSFTKAMSGLGNNKGANSAEWAAYQALIKYRETVLNYWDKLEEVESQMSEYATRINEGVNQELSVKGISIDNASQWGDKELLEYAKAVEDFISQMKLDPFIAKKIKKGIMDGLNFTEDQKKKLVVGIVPQVEDKRAQWQKDLQDYFDKNGIKIQIAENDTRQDIIKRMKDLKKDLQEQIKADGKVLIDVGFNLETIGESEGVISTVLGVFGMKGSWINEAYKEYTTNNPILNALNNAAKMLNANIDGNTSSSKADEQLKKWREEWTELKAFYSEFKKWAKEIGDDEALKKLRETGLWGQFFGKDGNLIYDIKEWEKAIGQFRNKLSGGTTEREKFMFEVSKEKLTPQYDQTKEAVEAILKQLDEELKKQGKQWNLYKKVFEATGSREQASEIAFGGIVDFTNMAEQLRKQIADELSDSQKTIGIDKLLGMDEKALRDAGIFENSKLARLLKELKEAQEQVKADDVEEMVNAMKKLADIEEQLAVVESKLAEARKKYGENSVQALALEKELAELRMKQLEESEPYLRFYSAVMGMTITEAEQAGAAIKENLVKQLADGTINADKYLKSLKNVDAQLQKIRGKKSLLAAFATGGVKGVISAKSDVVDAKAADAAIVLQMTEKELLKARQELERVTKNGTAEERIAAAGRVKGLEIQLEQDKQNLKEIQVKQNLLGLNAAQVESWNNVLSVIDKVLNAVDGVAKAFDQLREMFEALGQESRAAGWSDAADTLRAIMSPVQNATNAAKSALSGDVGGVISGTVGIVTAPVTAFAKLHDKRRERRLQASQKEVKKLTIEYQNLQKAMENALGGIYTTGGYDEMLTNLQAQRDEIQRQYDLENSKKDSDSDRLEDYKQQLQELDEQIKDFALDMAKALYDIDLKSWARDLTDAVVSAWENGEDAAEAYKKKVSDILKDLTKNILAQKVMEKAFDQLGIDKLIESEMFDSNGKLNEGVIGKLADKLNQAGEMTVNAITSTMDYLEQTGRIQKDESSGSSSGGSSIKSMTEQTADLLVSYVNAIRADVSVDRVTLQQILLAVQTQAAMPVIARAQLEQLQQIAGNTHRNAESAAAIFDLLKSNTLNGNKLHIA